MSESAVRELEQGARRLKVGIIRIDDQMAKELSEFWKALKASMKNPSSEARAEELGIRVNGMAGGAQSIRVFEAFEREMKSAQSRSEMGVRKSESDAFFAYASAGKTEDKANAMLDLRKDVSQCAEALSVLDSNAEKLGEQQLSRLMLLMEKGDVKKEEVTAALGKAPGGELADALYSLMRRQEAASVAAENFLGMDRDQCRETFGISARNEALALLGLYKRMLGDAKFARARENATRGDMAALLLEIRKMNLASQYIFFALLAPHLMRNGMWSSAALGILGKALGAIRGAAQKAGLDPAQSQMEYLHNARGFLSRFADFKGLNLSLFSASFLASMK